MTANHLQVYLVGGAVRDQLLGQPHKERDWVVVGATPEELASQGYQPIGKDFPVFLHPKTHEEYALARTERKISKGYKGFKVYATPDVTLEEDLKRRDLTINAMAQTDDGQLIDPFDGQQDLKDKILRHVSDAFIEDPVRVLRVARFAAKLGDFKVAPETNKLMQEMVASGEIDALVPERVWQELHRALEEKYPHRFIEVLRDCGALKIILPEIDALFGVPNPKKWHPEIDTGLHTIMALKAAVKLTDDPMIRFAVLVHDAGKAKTPKELWPKHHGHAEAGVQPVKSLCARLRAPRDYTEFAVLVTKYHHQCLKLNEFSAKALLKLLENLDAFRRPERFKKFLIACDADARGRTNYETVKKPQLEFIDNLQKQCANVTIPDEMKEKSNEDIMHFVHDARLSKIKKYFK
ncbi:MAG: multifunctional CCA addition/repair protein [Pseudomonadota bacterium]